MSVPILAALGAILLWGTLAALGASLGHLPPFLLTGLALAIGSLPGLARVRTWKVPASTLALGVSGLFGFHFLLFMALRLAPPVEANLVNYLWPLLIVLLTPVRLPGWRLERRHVVAAGIGFLGAAIAIGASPSPVDMRAATGFVLAACSASTWAVFSLAVRRVAPFPSWAIGGFAATSGALALACHALFEPRAEIAGGDWARLVALGLGPMGAAFYLWDYAIKRGDPRVIGTLAYATPVLSTAVLALATGRSWSWSLGLATLLVAGGAAIALRSGGRRG